MRLSLIVAFDVAILVIFVGCSPAPTKFQSYRITETTPRGEGFNFAVSDVTRIVRVKETVRVPVPNQGPLPKAAVTLAMNVIPDPEIMNQKRYPVTVYTGEDVNGKGTCPHCVADKRVNGNGNDVIELTWSTKLPPKGPPQTFPCYTWKDNQGRLRWPTKGGRKTLKELEDLIEISNAPPPSVMFGQSIAIETHSGRTSPEHLMEVHGLTREQIAPYLNNQEALDRIHGWAHGAPSFAPPGATVSGPRRRREPRTSAAGVAGTLQAKATVEEVIAWIRKYIGENVKMRFAWDRTGGHEFPLLRNQNWSPLAIYGRSGHISISAAGSKLPIQGFGFGYRILDNGNVIFDVDPIEMQGLAAKLVPQPAAVVGGAPQSEIVGIDPATVWTVFSVMRTLWSLLNPRADLILGGNVTATATLVGDQLLMDFQQMPRLKIVFVLPFDLGVKRVELSASKVRILFDGSFWIKERTFNIAPEERKSNASSNPVIVRHGGDGHRLDARLLFRDCHGQVLQAQLLEKQDRVVERGRRIVVRLTHVQHDRGPAVRVAASITKQQPYVLRSGFARCYAPGGRIYAQQTGGFSKHRNLPALWAPSRPERSRGRRGVACCDASSDRGPCSPASC